MSKKILLVCDDEAIKNLAVVVFKTWGYQPVVASDAQDGFQKARTEKPSIIVLDLNSSKIRSSDFCHALKNRPETSNMPIIMLTEGADDYLPKPFNINELKLRIQRLFWKAQQQTQQDDAKSVSVASVSIELSHTGCLELDELTGGGFPKGSNILLLGEVGSGKSVFCRNFVMAGLQNNEPCLYVSIDDSPLLIRRELTRMMGNPIDDYENNHKFCFVDAYNWGGGQLEYQEKFAIKGNLNLNNLSSLIIDASDYIGQNIQSKAGGRRIIDSLTSLLVNFDLGAIQKFIYPIIRTAGIYGNAMTVFVLEAGTADERIINNIRYLMDGVIEMKRTEEGKFLRIAHMKWVSYKRDWIKVDRFYVKL